MFIIMQNEKEIIELLESLFEQAKRGNLNSIVITAKYKTGETKWHMGGEDAVEAWNAVAALREKA